MLYSVPGFRRRSVISRTGILAKVLKGGVDVERNALAASARSRGTRKDGNSLRLLDLHLKPV